MTGKPTPPSPESLDGGRPIDVLGEPCPVARIETKLPLALIEDIDQARGPVSRLNCLAMVIDAAMTRPHPHLPEAPVGGDAIDALARRRYRQHVRSIELKRAEGSR
jgi:hypothetical protein